MPDFDIESANLKRSWGYKNRTWRSTRSNPIWKYHWNCYSRTRLLEYFADIPVEVTIFDLMPEQAKLYPMRSVCQVIHVRRCAKCRASR